MNRLLKIFILLFLLYGTYLRGNQFSATIEISSQTIAIFDTLRMKIKTTHPKGYAVDINQIRSNLIECAGFGPTPFIIESEESNVEDTLTTIEFVFIPQVPGTFFLTPIEIKFKKENEIIVIPSKLFEIIVNAPKRSLNYSGNPLPLISLIHPEPIVLSAENQEILDTKKDDKIDSIKILETRHRIIYTIIYFFIFLIIILFILLIPRETNKVS